MSGQSVNMVRGLWWWFVGQATGLRFSEQHRVQDPALGLAPTPRRDFLRGAALAVACPEPARAMWQLWTSDDMETFVARYGTPGDASSVLQAMDKCADTSWMMNMGPAKGDLIEASIKAKQPKRLLEIGTFLGYMSIRLARSMPKDAQLTTIEVDRKTYDASVRIRKTALGDDTLKRVTALYANASDVLASRKVGPFDAVLMDHWKPDYARDLETLRANGLLADGALVIADNVLFPGAPELLDYLNVPFVRSSDDVSGQPCLVSAADVDQAMIKRTQKQLRAYTARLKRGDEVEEEVRDLQETLEISLKITASRPSKDAIFQSNFFDTALVRSPFEYRPDTPDGMTFSTYVPPRR